MSFLHPTKKSIRTIVREEKPLRNLRKNYSRVYSTGKKAIDNTERKIIAEKNVRSKFTKLDYELEEEFFPAWAAENKFFGRNK